MSSEINYFKNFVLCSNDVDHLHVKIIHLVNTSYIVTREMLVHCCEKNKRINYYCVLL
jgi:hypothetical protein